MVQSPSASKENELGHNYFPAILDTKNVKQEGSR